MIKKIRTNIVLEDTQIRFRNFSGKAGQFNPEGKRNFCVLLDFELAKKLQEDGWNVRWLKPRDEEEAEQAYLQVAVSYDRYPPEIILVSSRGKTVLDNDSISLLDWAEITSVDVIISPYNWVRQEGTIHEKRGVKGYVKSMYVVITEDKFKEKYRDVPDSASDSIGGCGRCEACDGTCHGH